MIETHLDEIGRACGADKSSLQHHYLHYYHELLSPIRHQKVNMLEIGVLGGHSLCMWDAFFDHSGTTIWGVDIHDRWTPPPTSRINVRIGDASSEEFVSSLAIEAGMFDFIIDDGSHFSREQKLSLKYLWPYLKQGGIWITEDLHAGFSYPWTDQGEEMFIDSLKPWIHALNEHGLNDCGVPSVTDIEEITFRKSIVVIKKRTW